jgi:hypothetical protein
LTPDSIQQKYAQTVASTWITPSCLQFLGEKKRFHTAWTRCGHQGALESEAVAKKQSLIQSAELVLGLDVQGVTPHHRNGDTAMQPLAEAVLPTSSRH